MRGMKAFSKEFHPNEIRLRVQFRSFVLNKQHFENQTFQFAAAFLISPDQVTI